MLRNVHHVILSASVEKTFAKSRKGTSKSLFVKNLVAFLEEEGISMRSFSAQLGMSHASLSRMISGDIAISPTTVARVCNKLGDRDRGGALVEAYLRDQLNEVSRNLRKTQGWQLLEEVVIKAQKSRSQ